VFSNTAAAYPTPCDPRCGEGDAFRHLQMGGFVALAPTGAHAARAMLVNPRPGPAPLAVIDKYRQRGNATTAPLFTVLVWAAAWLFIAVVPYCFLAKAYATPGKTANSVAFRKRRFDRRPAYTSRTNLRVQGLPHPQTGRRKQCTNPQTP